MANPSRRQFLKILGLGGATLVAGRNAEARVTHEINDDTVGMLYDAVKCVGCKACMSACKRVNMEHGGLSYDKAKFDPDGMWDAQTDLNGNTRTIIKLYKESPQKWSYVKHSCMHCQKPSCVSACPVSALTRDKVTGIVDYDKSVCIGCRFCQVACSFNIPRFQWDRLNPQIVKCDLCKHTHLVKTGISACADVCPAGAIMFGKRKDLLAEAKNRIAALPDKYQKQIYGEKEAGGLNHLYIAAVPFEKIGLPTLSDKADANFSETIQHTIYKGFIAPVALYGTLCAIALRNKKKFYKDKEAAGKGCISCEQKGDK
jgi:Fe-S-cluster-containing dehydrogenase component